MDLQVKYTVEVIPMCTYIVRSHVIADPYARSVVSLYTFTPTFVDDLEHPWTMSCFFYS